MTEFNNAINAEQTAFLVDDKAKLYRTEDGKRIWQNRVKMAGEAYNIAKAIHNDHTLTALVPKTCEDEDDCDDQLFCDWPTYRDNFILDWIANRTIVTTEEADIMFDRTANAALAELEPTGLDVVEDLDSDAEAITSEVVPPSEAPPVVKKSYAKAKVKVEAVVKLFKKKAVKKVAAKKKSAAKGSASEKAQVIIEKYAARNWSRKDIIAKVQTQLNMGSAYAATLYQKFS